MPGVMIERPYVVFAQHAPQRHRRCLNAVLIAVIGLSTLFLSTCKEALPEYHRPAIVLSAHLTPNYSLTATENTLHFFITVKNIYDETLEGFLSVKGQVQFISRADPSIIKTFEVTRSNIATASWHFLKTGEVSFDPGGTAVFDVAWDLTQRPLTDDSGRDLTTGLLGLRTDPECLQSHRLKSDPQEFLIQSNIELFDRTGPAISNNVVYRFCLVNMWVNQRDCPIITAPCNVIVSGGN
jgi:hypothetical protein